MNSILAIDPGPEQSAYVLYDGHRPTEFAKIGNDEMLYRCGLCWHDGTMLVVEQIACMGMAVGAETFETVWWSGRFCERWKPRPAERMKRHEVKMFLCGNARAKDANIRQAVLDRYGGKEKAIGRKRTPGPLYGLSGDCWQALALAITFHETRSQSCREAV